MKRTFVLAFGLAFGLALELGGAAQGRTCRTLDSVFAVAPKFESFRVAAARIARPAPVDLRGNAQARRYRTALREAAKAGANFAGRYTIAGWGCGSGCLEWGVIDEKTGKVAFAAAASPLADLSDDWARNQAATRHYAAEGANAADFDLLLFKPDSALLITLGAPGEDEAKNGIAYWRWSGKRFERIHFVPAKSICRPD